MTLRFYSLALLNLSLALVGFLCVSSGVRAWLLPPPSSERAALDFFLETRDDYDAVYIGSSRFERGIRPEVIDPLMSTPERPFRSFNLAMPAMRSFEINYLMEYVLALGPLGSAT
jgi:hypothetical protein